MIQKTVTIEKLGGNGVSISRIDGQAVFVPYGVPGDEVELSLVRQTSSYAEAVITRVVKPSPFRVSPRCRHFGVCGGCDHQNISYGKQLEYKYNLLTEIFRHIIHAGAILEPFVPSPEQFGYRNKLQMQCAEIKGRLTAGFYERGTRRLVPVHHCPLHSEAVNACVSSAVEILNRAHIPAFDTQRRKGAVRDIVIRESEARGDLLLTLVSAERNMAGINALSKSLFRANPRLKGFYVFHNPHGGDEVFRSGEDAQLSQKNGLLKKVYGDLLFEKFSGINLFLSPLTFFQVNPPQAENICSLLKAAAEKDGAADGGTILPGLLDAHAGIGTFSLPLAGYFRQIMAAEIVSHACGLAREHAVKNGISNFTVRKGDAAAVLEQAFRGLGPAKFPESWSHILLDPPRAGLTEQLTDLVASLPFRKIWYVSCNPHTQARDADMLVKSGRYRVTRITPFDMFPHTGHMETVMELEGRSESVMEKG